MSWSTGFVCKAWIRPTCINRWKCLESLDRKQRAAVFTNIGNSDGWNQMGWSLRVVGGRVFKHRIRYSQAAGDALGRVHHPIPGKVRADCCRHSIHWFQGLFSSCHWSLELNCLCSPQGFTIIVVLSLIMEYWLWQCVIWTGSGLIWQMKHARYPWVNT